MNIKLQPLSRSDISLINKWRQDPELVHLLGAPFRYINLETDNEWFEGYMSNRSTQVRCMICIGKNLKPIGVIYLTNIDHINSSAEVSIMIGNKKYRGRGLGYNALIVMIRHGFNDLNLNRIYLTVLEKNIRAVKMYEKVGFKREGILRESVFKHGQYQNQIIMSLLKKDFKIK